MKGDSFETYITVVMDEYKADPSYHEKDDKTELWNRVNEIWDRNLEFKDILLQIESIKED